MKRIIKAIIRFPDYFDEYWWSYIQDSEDYFCDKNGNVLIPENCFSHNPIRHFLMCCKYDLKHWDKCNLENSIFESYTYDLVEINKICRKYGARTILAAQQYLDGKYIDHCDASVKEDKWYKKELKKRGKK